jgi:hypothetical protein
MSKAWKEHERRTARRLGGVRNPLSGSLSCNTGADIIHPRLYVECKYRSRFAFLTVMRQVEQKSKKEGKMPLLVLQEKNAKHAYILIPLNDLEVIHEIVTSCPGKAKL